MFVFVVQDAAHRAICRQRTTPCAQICPFYVSTKWHAFRNLLFLSTQFSAGQCVEELKRGGK